MLTWTSADFTLVHLHACSPGHLQISHLYICTLHVCKPYITPYTCTSARLHLCTHRSCTPHTCTCAHIAPAHRTPAQMHDSHLYICAPYTCFNQIMTHSTCVKTSNTMRKPSRRADRCYSVLVTNQQSTISCKTFKKKKKNKAQSKAIVSNNLNLEAIRNNSKLAETMRS